MSRILPRYYRHQEAAADHQHINTILNETAPLEQTPARTGQTPTPADKRRLRGIPVAGFGGTSPGTDPLKEALRNNQ